MSCGSESFSVGNRPGRDAFRGWTVGGRDGPAPRQEPKAAHPQKNQRENLDRNSSSHSAPLIVAGTRRGDKLSHQGGDLVSSRVQGEMTRVENVHLGVWYVPPIGFRL
jgi:hypothetical protein